MPNYIIFNINMSNGTIKSINSKIYLKLKKKKPKIYIISTQSSCYFINIYIKLKILQLGNIILKNK